MSTERIHDPRDGEPGPLEVEDTLAYAQWMAEQRAVQRAVEQYDPRALADAVARRDEWTSGEVWR